MGTQRVRRGWRAVALVVVVAVIAACATGTGGTAGQPAPGAPSNAEVANVMITANQGEVETGQLAVQRATRTAVRDFAQRMVGDHGTAAQRLQALGVGMAPHPLAQQLGTTADRTTQTLGQYQGEAFDRPYIDSQIEIHQYLLNTLDSFLIPSTTDRRLRTELEQQRAVISDHLTRARQIRMQGL